MKSTESQKIADSVSGNRNSAREAKLLRKAMTVLNRIIPKTRLIIFNSFPDYSDNAYALLNYILKNRPDIMKKYRILWSYSNRPEPPAELVQKGVKIIRKKSLKGYWAFFRAKYVISTHGYFINVLSGKGQIQVNLWHGCGYKKLPPEDICYRGDYSIVVGESYRSLIARELGMKEAFIWNTGYPRNDDLFHDSGALAKLGMKTGTYKKILVWLPTYRAAKQGHNTVDGETDSFLASNMTVEEWGEVDRILLEKGAFLMVKLHPMDLQSLPSNRSENIRFLTDDELYEKGTKLYEILAETDILLSDYSSVIVDFLLTDRPIALTYSDKEAYRNNRGFLFEHIDDYIPGPVIACLGELMNYLKNMDAINKKWMLKRGGGKKEAAFLL